MGKTIFSVIIPAHNEAQYIGKCLRAIGVAAQAVAPDAVETIVVANRCTDKTREIAEGLGARVLVNDDKCISAVRNTGVRAAAGEIVVTVDADSVMGKDALAEIKEKLESGNYVGGGSNVRFDRMSFGIACSSLYVVLNLLPVMLKNGRALSGAMFWCRREDFEAIGGFDESLISLEDMDFAARLKQLGKQRKQKYGTLKRTPS